MSKGKREKPNIVGAICVENGASFMVAAEEFIRGVVLAVDVPQLGQVVMELKPHEALKLGELLDMAALTIEGPRACPEESTFGQRGGGGAEEVKPG